MFGYGSQNGYSITNLGKIKSNIIEEAIFIPPASPANKTTWGVLTVNSRMKVCVSNLIVRSWLTKWQIVCSCEYSGGKNDVFKGNDRSVWVYAQWQSIK